MSAAAGAAYSQEFETRADAIASLQEGKSKKVQPYQEDKAEHLIRKFEAIFLEDPSGVYPYFASVYHGGGLTGGVGYRKFYGDNTNWFVQGLYSVKNYKLIEGGTESKDHLAKRLSFGTKAGWRDATQVAYYGLGMKNTPDDRTNFRFRETYADGHTTFRPIKWSVIKGTVAYEHWEILEGKGGFPTTQAIHTTQSAPGLGANPSFVHSTASAGFDWRPSPGYARRGGLYEVTLDDYHSVRGGAYGFQKLTGEVIQHLPLLRETWVLAARGRVETTLRDGDVVPYFLLPKLGSGNTLRAYAADRFRDRHSMLMNAEFRWLPSIGLDMAFFYDMGKVAPYRHDLSFKGLKSDVGVGARFHGLLATPLRVDFAVGNEGWRIVISGGPPF